MREVNKKMARGAAWMVSFKFVERGLGLVSTVILARLLIPEDFGVVAMAMSLIAVSELLGAFSFDLALIQNRDAGPEHYNSAWTLNVLLAGTTALVILALAGPVAHFYQEPRLVPIILVLAIGSVVEGLENIGVVAFRKELTFDREFKYRIFKKIAGFSVAVPLAFILRNYWALVAGTVIGRIAGVGLSYWMHAYRPAFSLKKVGDLLRFSTWTFLNNLLGFIHQRSADFVLGRIAGAAQLGIFRVGYEISNLPTTELVAPINRAVFPAYSAIASNRQELQLGYLSVMGAIAFFAIPAGLGIAALAELLTPLLLGNKWLAAIPIIEIMAFFGITQAIQSNFYSVYLALGKPGVMTIILAFSLTLSLPLIIILSGSFGAIGAAIAYLISAVVIAPIKFVVVARVLHLPIGTIMRVLIRPLLSGLLMFLFLKTIVRVLAVPDSILQLFTTVIGLVALGVLSYAILAAILWKLAGKPDGTERLFLDKAIQRLNTWGLND